ncbi:stage III sporulation protein AG [Clostridium tarantellae]|uniref:Stage III sporulation protein AG n=1 Tax=Clostridium tarantellae TaxID=39493 RepID=A0A6I1MHZ6_9CLOT|nr:stage III sporulation protein AG [Clostridium tarantellae]MPQ42760.1 stage III sporulation protein AG [Clostridium tarantellae]
MDYKKLKERFETILKQKNIGNLIIILLIVIMFFLVVSYFSGVNNISKSKKVNIEPKNEEMNLEANETMISDYEKEQKKALTEILKKIDGVGNVEVMINFESSEIKVPAIENSSTKNITEESDSEGGKRINNQETTGGKVVISTNVEGNEPLILKTEKPKITGIVVVAEGADNSKINYEIRKAISSLYDIGVDKVNVFAMKKN